MPFFHRGRKSGAFGFDNRNLINLALRFCQLVLGLAVIGLYGQDLHRAALKHAYSDAKWVFATTTASLSASTALIYILTTILSSSTTISLLCPWDFILVVLWAAVTGIFGSMYVRENPEMDSGVVRMKHAVWVDLVNLVLWLSTTLWGAWVWHRTPSRWLHRSPPAKT